MSSVPARSEIDSAYRWDLERIFESEEEWQSACDEVRELAAELEAYEGSVAADGETLCAVLETRDRLLRRAETVAAYARMRRDEDTRDQDAQALFTRAQSVLTEARSATSFVEPAIQSLDRETLESMRDAVPDLETYDHHLDDVRRMKPHTRSAEVEGLLADLGEVLGGTGETYTMLANADMTFPAVEDADGEAVQVTQSNLTSLLKRPDRSFRRRVYEAYFDEWGAVRNAVATTYRTSVKGDVRLAEARGYDTAREAALDGPNVPVDVYDTLVSAVRSSLDPLHRHLALKRRALEVDELRMWDVYMPVTEGEPPSIPYEEAREHVLAAVEPLGPAYRSRVAEGLDSRWVDVYETAGKRSGAYSGGTYDTDPFVLMNYQRDISSMFTLAHELGHSMHSVLTAESQPYVYSSYEIFVAEIASMVNEALLTAHLLEEGPEPLRPYVRNEFLERVRSTLYRQTMFAEFEQRVHEREEAGRALTPDSLDACYRELKAAYYEPAALDDRIEREWMRIPHFYRAFYVYQYATGLSAALAIADRIRTEGEEAAADYRSFLRRGSREYPMELCAIAGIDVEGGAAIERALSVYDDRVREFEG